jgi:hypothetical protein
MPTVKPARGRGRGLGAADFGTLSIGQRPSRWTRETWRVVPAPAVGAFMGGDDKLYSVLPDDKEAAALEQKQDAELAQEARKMWAAQEAEREAEVKRDQSEAEQEAKRDLEESVHEAQQSREDDYDGMAVHSDDEEQTLEDTRMLVDHHVLDHVDAGTVTHFTDTDYETERVVLKALVRAMITGSVDASKSALVELADSDLFNKLETKKGRGTALSPREKHHLDRLNRMKTAAKERGAVELDRQVINFTSGLAGLTDQARTYTAQLSDQNRTATEQLQAPTSGHNATDLGELNDDQDRLHQTDLGDGRRRSFEEISKVFAARRAAAELARDTIDQQAARTSALASIAYNGPADNAEEEEEDQGFGRAGGSAFVAAITTARTTAAPSQAIDTATSASRWRTAIASQRAGSESVPTEGGASAQCAPRDPLPDPHRLGTDGNLVFQVACFEMIIDIILRHVCTGTVLPATVRFDIVNMLAAMRSQGVSPADREIAWSAVLGHASCTPHVLLADEKAYATMVDAESQLDAECQDQLRASKQVEQGMLLLTSPTLLRLVVTLVVGGRNHVLVAVGTAATLPSLLAAQVGPGLGIGKQYLNDLAGCHEFMAMLLPKKEKKTKKAKRGGGEGGSGSGGGGAKATKTIGGPCSGTAARMINAQEGVDAERHADDINTVLHALAEDPAAAPALAVRPAVKIVDGKVVPGIEIVGSAPLPPTEAQIAAVGGCKFHDVTLLGSENPLVEQAIRRLAQEGGTGPSAPMEDVAQAQRAVQRRETPLTEKRNVLAIWAEMDTARQYDLTQDLEKKLGQTVNMLGRRLINDMETFLAVVNSVAPTVEKLLRGSNRATAGDPYDDEVLQMVRKHSPVLAKPEAAHIAKTTVAYLTAFQSACTTAYLQASTLAQRRGGGKATEGRPKVGAPALTTPSNEFGALFLFLLQADPTDPTVAEV